MIIYSVYVYNWCWEGRRRKAEESLIRQGGNEWKVMKSPMTDAFKLEPWTVKYLGHLLLVCINKTNKKVLVALGQEVQRLTFGCGLCLDSWSRGMLRGNGLTLTSVSVLVVDSCQRRVSLDVHSRYQWKQQRHYASAPPR